MSKNKKDGHSIGLFELYSGSVNPVGQSSSVPVSKVYFRLLKSLPLLIFIWAIVLTLIIISTKFHVNWRTKMEGLSRLIPNGVDVTTFRHQSKAADDWLIAVSNLDLRQSHVLLCNGFSEA